MAKINWKTKEEVAQESKVIPSTLDLLAQQIDDLTKRVEALEIKNP
jgi:hypothetical protein